MEIFERSYPVYTSFLELSPSEQDDFLLLCLVHENNAIRRYAQGYEAAMLRLDETIRNKGHPGNDGRGNKIIEIREREGVSFGQIGRDPRVTKLNGGKKLSYKATEQAYRRAKLAQLQINV